ncbi:MAG: hypothetical protein AAF902_21675 [Chloroflexota bacterium]
MKLNKWIPHILIGVITAFLFLIQLRLIWIWSLIFVIANLFVILITTPNEKLRILLINLIVIPIALLCAESYFKFGISNQVPFMMGSHTTDSYYQSDPILGYSPQPNSERASKKMIGDTIIYDVVYTIDDKGFRSTPYSDLDSRRCLLFFGGSFVFGEGLENDETIPSLVGKFSDEEKKIFNLGFHGYGPHQMLASIQNDKVKNILLNCEFFDAFYIGHPQHVERSAGKVSWDRNGPKYVLNNNQLENVGSFSSNPNQKIKRLFRSVLNQSALYQRLFLSKPANVTPNELDTYIEIIFESQQSLKEYESFSSFSVVFWDTPQTDIHGIMWNRSNKIIDAFSAHKINFYLVSEILPDYDADQDKYVLSPFDLHPNQTANQLIAFFLADKISN